MSRQQRASKETERILNENSDAAILGVEPNCYEHEVITPRYKKIAKLIDPKKNDHPKAQIAFQKLSHAYQVYTNEDFREKLQNGEKNICDPLSPDVLFKMIVVGKTSSKTKLDQPPFYLIALSYFIQLLPTIILFTLGQLYTPGSYVSNMYYKINCPINRNNLKGHVLFNETSGNIYPLKSWRFDISYGIPVQWMDENLGPYISEEENKNLFHNDLIRMCDQLYMEHLEIQCALETNALGSYGKKCLTFDKVKAQFKKNPK